MQYFNIVDYKITFKCSLFIKLSVYTCIKSPLTMKLNVHDQRVHYLQN